MTQRFLREPGRIDEPCAAEEYSDVFTRVAAQRQPVIVRRNGTDLAAVIPLEHLDLLRELLERAYLKKLAARIDGRVVHDHPPPQSWFDDNDNRFVPEEPGT